MYIHVIKSLIRLCFQIYNSENVGFGGFAMETPENCDACQDMQKIGRADGAQHYIHYLSVLKCAGMLAVIGIHVFCTPVTYWHEAFSSAELFIAFFVTNILRCWAVPVFVMASGALFLGRQTDVRRMWGKYILRLALVLLTFGMMFALMEIMFDERALRPAMILSALKRVYAGETWGHLWFVYMCMGLYIVTPPLQRMLRSLDSSALKYLLAVLFVFNCFVPFLNGITEVTFGVYIPVAGIWLFYYLLGYALHNDVIKIDTRLSIIFILLGVLWCSLGQLVPNMRDFYSAHLRYADTADIVGVLVSLGIFSLAKSKCSQRMDFLDTAVNPLTFGVYIIHAFFINLMLKALHFTPDRFSAPLVWAVVYAVTAVGSLFSVWLLRKFPFVRKRIL